MKKHSVYLFGHATSFSLEEEFYDELKSIADRQKMSVTKLIEEIDSERGFVPLSESLRLFILKDLQTRLKK